LSSDGFHFSLLLEVFSERKEESKEGVMTLVEKDQRHAKEQNN